MSSYRLYELLFIYCAHIRSSINVSDINGITKFKSFINKMEKRTELFRMVPKSSMEQGTWWLDEIKYWLQILHSNSKPPAVILRQVLSSPGFFTHLMLCWYFHLPWGCFPRRNQTVAVGYLVIALTVLSLVSILKSIQLSFLKNRAAC